MNFAYEYTAKNPRGLVVDGTVYTSCYDDAIFAIRSALKLEPSRVKLNLLESLRRVFSDELPPRDVVRVYRTIAQRKRIGKSIPQGIGEAVEYVEDRRLVSRLMVMRQALIDGMKFADAMELGGFPETDVQALRAVQSAGKEGETLDQLAEHMEVVQGLKRGIADILWYPLLVLLTVWIVSWGATLFVAPKIGDFFSRISGLQLALPAYAAKYYAAAAWMNAHAILSTLLWFGVPLALLLLALRFRLIARLSDRVDTLRAISEKSDLIAIFSSLGLLLGAGVKPVESFAAVARAARRADNKERLSEMTAIYRAGNFSIGRAAKLCEFPRYVQTELAAGESANSTTQGIKNLVALLRQDLERHVEHAKRLILIVSNVFVAIFLLMFVFVVYYPQISATMSRL